MHRAFTTLLATALLAGFGSNINATEGNILKIKAEFEAVPNRGKVEGRRFRLFDISSWKTTIDPDGVFEFKLSLEFDHNVAEFAEATFLNGYVQVGPRPTVQRVSDNLSQVVNIHGKFADCDPNLDLNCKLPSSDIFEVVFWNIEPARAPADAYFKVLARDEKRDALDDFITSFEVDDDGGLILDGLGRPIKNTYGPNGIVPAVASPIVLVEGPDPPLSAEPPNRLVPNPPGIRGDARFSFIYDANTGEVGIDVPPPRDDGRPRGALTALNLQSEPEELFAGMGPIQNLDGQFDVFEPGVIFKTVFGESFDSLTFGNVAQPGLTREELLANILTFGALADPPQAAGLFDLIYIPMVVDNPEPSTLVLASIGCLIAVGGSGRRARPRRPCPKRPAIR